MDVPVKPEPEPESSSDGGVLSPLKKGIKWLDDYTSPRPHTAGNFNGASLFQAAFQGGTEGFYLWGLPGAAAGAASALGGATAQNKSGSQILGLVTGTGVGAAAGYVIGLYTGNPGAVANGALLGLFQTIRAHGESRVRDSGGNATMISAFGVDGPAKLGGGLGAVAGVRLGSQLAETEFLKDKPKMQKLVTAVIGGATGAAAGAVLAQVFNPPGGLATIMAYSAAAGAAGPFIGPRFSQFFRNLAEDIGKGIEKVLPTEVDEKKRNALGSLPASFIKEGIRGYQYSDGGLSGFVLGGIMETVQQAQIALFAKEEKPDGDDPPGPAKPAEPPQSSDVREAA